MDVTYNFTAGTRAVAQQVDQNFADVKSAVDPLETAVADIETQLTSGIILPDGSVDFTRLQSYKTYTVSNATNATPIVVTAVAHSFLTGDKVYISGVGGNTAANGIFTITKIGVDTFSLDGSVGNGAFTTNGTAIIYPTADDNLVNKVYTDNLANSLNFPTASTANMPTIANNTTDANNDIDFSAGFCYDLTTEVKIVSTAMTKRLDAVFAEGTNQGGLFSGSKANSTTYHCFEISKADGTTDCGFSTSVTASDIPTGYVNNRRIASIMTNASGNIIKFIQHGDIFYTEQALAYSATSGIPTTATSLVLPVPIGIRVKALAYIVLNDAVGRSILFGEVGSSVITIPVIYCATSAQNTTTIETPYTNISGAITHYKTVGTTATAYTIYLQAYIDARKGIN